MSVAEEPNFSDLSISDSQPADQERTQLEREKGRSKASEILRKQSFEAVSYHIFGSF